jgi:hypothetical protein
MSSGAPSRELYLGSISVSGAVASLGKVRTPRLEKKKEVSVLKSIGSLGARLVARVVPSITAEAAAAACTNVYSHCATGECAIYWQDRIAYDRFCDGKYQYTWYADCGSCAA